MAARARPKTRAAAGSPRRAPSPRAARKPATVAHIVGALRERIARQDIPPGAKLREHDLAEEFGVPRTRIRDVARRARAARPRRAHPQPRRRGHAPGPVAGLPALRRCARCSRACACGSRPSACPRSAGGGSCRALPRADEGSHRAQRASTPTSTATRRCAAPHRGRGNPVARPRCSTASTRRPTSSSAASSSCRGAPRSAGSSTRHARGDAPRRGGSRPSGDARESLRSAKAHLRASRSTSSERPSPWTDRWQTGSCGPRGPARPATACWRWARPWPARSAGACSPTSAPRSSRSSPPRATPCAPWASTSHGKSLYAASIFRNKSLIVVDLRRPEGQRDRARDLRGEDATWWSRTSSPGTLGALGPRLRGDFRAPTRAS